MLLYFRKGFSVLMIEYSILMSAGSALVHFFPSCEVTASVFHRPQLEVIRCSLLLDPHDPVRVEVVLSPRTWLHA